MSTFSKVGVYDVVVCCDQDPYHMAAACNYDWVDSDIPLRHFPILIKGQGKQKVQITILRFIPEEIGGKKRIYIQSDYVIAEMDKVGFCPVGPVEGLALGKKYPDLQRKFPIVILGSSWQPPDGRRVVLCLTMCDRGRWLALYDFRKNWCECFRFAATSK